MSSKSKIKNLKYQITLLLAIIMFCSCDPEAKWETSDVEITINVQTVSAAFIRCEFKTNKEAYYLISCEPVVKDVDPMSYQKQFMMLSLDSANVEYLAWRHEQLLNGEFNIAPFSSHALQYGNVNHVFTLLEADTDYWVYAFVVNPETMAPVGKLYLTTVHTAPYSTVDVTFEYRVDYYPYIAATCDSAFVADTYGQTPYERLYELFSFIAESKDLLEENIRFGVNAIDNSFLGTGYVTFEEGATYYTAIAGCDGEMGSLSVYRYVWTGDDFEAYFTDEDNILSNW